MTVKKFKSFFNYEKEEAWLREMANKGYELRKCGFGYTFEKTEPRDTVIKIDYRHFKKLQDFWDYCTLFEDSGWKHVAGTKNSGAQYFKKTEISGSDDIFSDTASRAGRYKRLSDTFFMLFAVWFMLCAGEVIVRIIDGTLTLDFFVNYKSFYFTQGLWEMSGSDFWHHFLIETPFAVFRAFPPFLMTVCCILYFICFIKSKREYKKAKK